MTRQDMVDYLKAISAACPANAERDRYGRLCGVRNQEKLRLLAIKWKIESGGEDSFDQAAMIARKMLVDLIR